MQVLMCDAEADKCTLRQPDVPMGDVSVIPHACLVSMPMLQGTQHTSEQVHPVQYPTTHHTTPYYCYYYYYHYY